MSQLLVTADSSAKPLGPACQHSRCWLLPWGRQTPATGDAASDPSGCLPGMETGRCLRPAQAAGLGAGHRGPQSGTKHAPGLGALASPGHKCAWGLRPLPAPRSRDSRAGTRQQLLGALDSGSITTAREGTAPATPGHGSIGSQHSATSRQPPRGRACRTRIQEAASEQGASSTASAPSCPRALGKLCSPKRHEGIICSCSCCCCFHSALQGTRACLPARPPASRTPPTCGHTRLHAHAHLHAGTHTHACSHPPLCQRRFNYSDTSIIGDTFLW